jgi:hypothetical protein
MQSVEYNGGYKTHHYDLLYTVPMQNRNWSEEGVQEDDEVDKEEREESEEGLEVEEEEVEVEVGTCMCLLDTICKRHLLDEKSCHHIDNTSTNYLCYI